jgi:hypothetical protein
MKPPLNCVSRWSMGEVPKGDSPLLQGTNLTLDSPSETLKRPSLDPAGPYRSERRSCSHAGTRTVTSGPVSTMARTFWPRYRPPGARNKCLDFGLAKLGRYAKASGPITNASSRHPRASMPNTLESHPRMKGAVGRLVPDDRWETSPNEQAVRSISTKARPRRERPVPAERVSETGLPHRLAIRPCTVVNLRLDRKPNKVVWDTKRPSVASVARTRLAAAERSPPPSASSSRSRWRSPEITSASGLSGPFTATPSSCRAPWARSSGLIEATGASRGTRSKPKPRSRDRRVATLPGLGA